jgi:pyruvate/2-oxoglutarate dehydrogenase complex dihydrolipoamide acyltransferase (E2) component
VQACLTFDHRAIDGGPAAAFLATLAGLVADLPRIPS